VSFGGRRKCQNGEDDLPNPAFEEAASQEKPLPKLQTSVSYAKLLATFVGRFHVGNPGQENYSSLRFKRGNNMLPYRALRSIIRAVVLTGAMVLVPTVAMADPPPIPTGLVAVITNDPGTPLDLKPFRNRTISGIAFQINWNDISLSGPTYVKQVTQVPGEPPVIKIVTVPGKTDWTQLDELFAAAQKYNKWVQLLVFPGFDTPAWALKGAQTDQFPIPYGIRELSQTIPAVVQAGILDIVRASA
jgi:hypothetical protein